MIKVRTAAEIDPLPFDLVILGAGAAGEAAANLGAKAGARVAIVEPELVGGECPFWACMPSKALLEQAARTGDGSSDWPHAASLRDRVIAKQPDGTLDDREHVDDLVATGTRVIRGYGSVPAPGRVDVRPADGPTFRLRASNVIICVGSAPIMPSIEGLNPRIAWTTRDAMTAPAVPLPCS